MTKNKLSTWGGHSYESPMVDVVDIEVEQAVFQSSGEYGIPDYEEEDEIYFE